MRKSKPSKIKRASLDVKKLRLLTSTTLKKITGGGKRLGGNSYWN